MDVLLENLGFFKGFVHLSKKQSKAILNHLTKDQTRVICEMAANVLRQNLKLGQTDKTSLAKHRSIIRKLARRELTHKQRESIIKNNTPAVVRLIQAAVRSLEKLK